MSLQEEGTEKYDDEERKTTIFAVKTTISREKYVLDKMFQKLIVVKPFPDIKAMIVAEELRGYVFVEARFKRDVQLVISGVRHVKGKILGSITLKSIFEIIKPRRVQELLEVGDTVEIVSGVFEGRRGRVVTMPGNEAAKQEVTLSLLDSDNTIPISIHGDFLKLVEKGETHQEKYDIKEMEMDEAGIESPVKDLITPLSPGEGGDIFSFDEEFDDDYVYEEVDEKSKTTEKEDDEEDDEEEDDAWSKFSF